MKDEPNIDSPAQQEPLNLYKNDRKRYLENAKQFAAKCKQPLKWVDGMRKEGFLGNKKDDIAYSYDCKINSINQFNKDR